MLKHLLIRGVDRQSHVEGVAPAGWFDREGDIWSSGAGSKYGEGPA
jgi:hypothetical protein